MCAALGGWVVDRKKERGMDRWIGEGCGVWVSCFFFFLLPTYFLFFYFFSFSEKKSRVVL